jgi:hypothetical protein
MIVTTWCSVTNSPSASISLRTLPMCLPAPIGELDVSRTLGSPVRDVEDRFALSSAHRGIIDEFFAEAMAHYNPGSVSLEITGMIAERDQVVLRWTSRAQARDGRQYENGGLGVFSICDGKIRNVREYMDTLYASEVAFSGGERVP